TPHAKQIAARRRTFRSIRSPRKRVADQLHTLGVRDAINFNEPCCSFIGAHADLGFLAYVSRSRRSNRSESRKDVSYR
ncbi:hypothetical protein, partial [Paucimonas lemoignei]|uniref:hypothetical protein n=1 Tax=Paucimonas lemoignei TaxID=29443 RepID=UPI001A9E5F4B